MLNHQISFLGTWLNYSSMLFKSFKLCAIAEPPTEVIWDPFDGKLMSLRHLCNFSKMNGKASAVARRAGLIAENWNLDKSTGHLVITYWQKGRLVSGSR